MNNKVENISCGNGSLPISAIDQCSSFTIYGRWHSTSTDHDCILNKIMVPLADSCEGIYIYIYM